MDTSRTRRRVIAIFGVVVVLPVLAAIGFIVWYRVSYETFYIQSGAMLPTFQVLDTILAKRDAYASDKPIDGQIVTFTPPIPSKTSFIKRIVASPGETLRIRNGHVFRDGAEVREGYVKEPTGYELEVKNYAIYVDGEPLDLEQANVPPRSDWTAPDRVPAGCYLVLGDNRNDSEDSHLWGCAQGSGTFWSGPRAGGRATPFEHLLKIVWPPDRRADLP